MSSKSPAGRNESPFYNYLRKIEGGQRIKGVHWKDTICAPKECAAKYESKY